MTTATPLVRYDAMCRAIDAAYEVDEVKEIRDKAIAFETYAKQAKNTEAERRACEIRLRAERKAGQLLRDIEKAKGTRGQIRGRDSSGGFTMRPPEENSARRLHELGASKNQSFRWQQLAAVPEEEFEATLAGPEKPTTNGLIKRPPKREPMNPKALWLWGRLRDFERDGILSEDPAVLFSEMTDAMQADVRRMMPLVIEWLEGVVEHEH